MNPSITFTYTCPVSKTTTSLTKEANGPDGFFVGDFLEAVLEFYATLGYCTSVNITAGTGGFFPEDNLSYTREDYIKRSGGVASLFNNKVSDQEDYASFVDYDGNEGEPAPSSYCPCRACTCAE